MTDTRIRELERYASTTKDPADAARVIEAKLQAGIECRQCSGHGKRVYGLAVLSRNIATQTTICSQCAGLSYQRRVELAAYLGHTASRMLDPKQWAFTSVTFKSINSWAKGLEAWGQLPAVRAAIATGLLALPAFARLNHRNCDGTGKLPILNYYDNTFTGRFEEQPCHCCRIERNAFNAATKWIDCPCNDHLTILETIARIPPSQQRYWTSVVRAIVSDKFWKTWPADAIVDCKHYVTDSAIHDAIRETLVPWCLA